MQVTLSVIFAGSVALAQIVVVHHHHSAHQGTSIATGLGPLKRMNLPLGWVIRSHDKAPVFLFDQEPDRPEQQGRTLTGTWEQLPKVISVQDYLQSTQLADLEVRVVAVDGHADEQIQMGDGMGVLIATTHGSGPEKPQITWIACTIRPDGKAITLVLDCPESTDPAADKQTLLETAQSMQFRE